LSKKVEGIFRDAGSNCDFTKVRYVDGEDWSGFSTTEKANRVQGFNMKMETLAREVQDLVTEEKRKNGGGMFDMIHPGAGGFEGDANEDLGDFLTDNSELKNWAGPGGKVNQWAGEIDVRPSRLFKFGLGLKTLFQTSAGWAPQSIRQAGLVEAVTRPPAVIDVVPVLPSGITGSVTWMLETTRTHAAAEKGEGVAYAESEFVLTEQTSIVRKITDSIPVTDEQLEDVPGCGDYLSNRLIFGVRQRLDTQILTGNGVAPNLLGINNTPNIQTHAKGADPAPDALLKGAVKVMTTGRAYPNVAVLHPNDWQDIRLLRTADGIYIFGAPNEPGPSSIWGMRQVVTDGQTENTGLVGDFANFCIFFERKGVNVQTGYIGDNFKEGKRTLRADLRGVFVVTRPGAFCTVTGI